MAVTTMTFGSITMTFGRIEPKVEDILENAEWNFSKGMVHYAIDNFNDAFMKGSEEGRKGLIKCGDQSFKEYWMSNAIKAYNLAYDIEGLLKVGEEIFKGFKDKKSTIHAPWDYNFSTIEKAVLAFKLAGNKGRVAECADIIFEESNGNHKALEKAFEVYKSVNHKEGMIKCANLIFEGKEPFKGWPGLCSILNDNKSFAELLKMYEDAGRTSLNISGKKTGNYFMPWTWKIE